MNPNSMECLPTLPPRPSALQDQAFRRVGTFATLAGAIGFSPSLYKMLTDRVWSVSRNAPATDTDFLAAHSFPMVLWVLLCLVQLWSGSVPRRRLVHRIGGWVGSFSFALGLLLAACYVVKYDVFVHGDIGPGTYTSLLIVASGVDLFLGVRRATQKRFAEHKDYMLMAMMMSLDPAIHRLSMWLIRLGAGNQHLPALTLLAVGKLPANFFLVSAFGAALVQARRVNRVTLGNLSLQLVAFVAGAVLVVHHRGDCEGCAGPKLVSSVLVGAFLLLLVLTALVATDRRLNARDMRSAKQS